MPGCELCKRGAKIQLIEVVLEWAELLGKEEMGVRQRRRSLAAQGILIFFESEVSKFRLNQIVVFKILKIVGHDTASFWRHAPRLRPT